MDEYETKSDMNQIKKTNVAKNTNKENKYQVIWTATTKMVLHNHKHRLCYITKKKILSIIWLVEEMNENDTTNGSNGEKGELCVYSCCQWIMNMNAIKQIMGYEMRWSDNTNHKFFLMKHKRQIPQRCRYK